MLVGRLGMSPGLHIMGKDSTTVFTFLLEKKLGIIKSDKIFVLVFINLMTLSEEAFALPLTTRSNANNDTPAPA